MAATLMRIKTRMLLPVQVDEEMDEEDPRAELVRRLLEYKRFKEAAASLRKCEEDRRRYHLRQSRYPFLNRENIEPPLRLGLFDLLSALANVFDRIVTPAVHHVQREPFTVEEKTALIRERLRDGATVHFEDLFDTDAIKMEVIVTFIAILEMIRLGFIVFFQTENLGPIWIKRNGNSAVWDEDAGDTARASGRHELEARG
jgi:segregation and condensation protein A